MNGFYRSTGIALALGALLLMLINVFLTPSYLASFEQGEAFARTSGIYLLRISAALVDMLLFLYGSIGLYLSHKGVLGKLGAIAFLATFVGNSFLLAIEWSNLFVLRAVAQTSPEALSLLDKSPLMSAGFASGASLFILGWFLFSASLWRAKVSPRWAASSALAGLLLIPILGASPLGIIGQVVGNVVFGVGLIGLSNPLIRAE